MANPVSANAKATTMLLTVGAAANLRNDDEPMLTMEENLLLDRRQENSRTLDTLIAFGNSEYMKSMFRN